MNDIAAYFLLALRLLMALALYAFLGWALLNIWRDLKAQAQQTTTAVAPPIRLTAQHDGAEPLRFTVSEITIGRHPTCEWVLDDETVSSRHARLSFHDEHWWLEDLASRNGTFLNQDRIIEAVVLANQDAVRCGEASFIVSLESQS